MIIVIAIDSYNDANGGTIATKRLVEELRRRGHEVRIIAAIHEDPSDPFYYEVPGFVLPGAEESQENMTFLFGKKDKKVMRKAMEGADVVQVQFPFLMARSVVKMAKRMEIPVLGAFHVQPQNIMAALNKTSKWLERLLWMSFKYFLFNRIDTIISPSKFASDLLISEGVKANHHYISNGIPVEYVPKKYKRPRWFGDKLVLINIGRHADEKRQILLIEGLKKSKYKDDIQLILAGRGERTQSLKEAAKSLPVEPYIDYIRYEDKLHYLNTADMYVHGSIVELESLSTSEAVGCGLPCLISDSKYSAASQFALDERFLFQSDNADDLAKKIDFWYEHKEELRSAEIKKQVLSNAEYYRFERSVNSYEAVLGELINPSSEEIPELVLKTKRIYP
jgi:glycosyltransferase involved in cell wall biosynthesis